MRSQLALSTVYWLLFTVYSLQSSFYCLLSSVYCLLYNVYGLLSTVYCLLSTVKCLLSYVFCLLCTGLSLKPIPKSKFADLNIPNLCIKTQTNQPNNQLPKYRAIPDFVIFGNMSFVVAFSKEPIFLGYE